MWSVYDVTLNQGEKKQTVFHPYGMEYDIPATLICGKEEGMTMLVSAQIHSGEYNGSAAVMRLAETIEPQKLKGNLILMHCVNTSGFWSRKHRFVPEDRANLNSNFPGSKMGTVGNKIAAWFVEEIFPKTDFIADLHGGKDHDLLEPCVFYPRAEKVNRVSLEAAKCLNTKYLLASSNSVGLYGYAANRMDIPGMILERGYGCVLKEEWIQGHMDSVLLLMEHFGMMQLEKEIEKPVQVDYKRSEYTVVDTRGVWQPMVQPNQKMKKGDLMANVCDFFGNIKKSYYAVADGTVIYLNHGLLVEDGDEAIAYGLDE
ncbi:MAG: succinylglutamate desuccinylase/aspartoacylase family protein [Lachnospiraceae bacterium]|nr:succinylglutamate desuccinylase/aspartoacylase family protein [Lachnospiraceae bacterium]